MTAYAPLALAIARVLFDETHRLLLAESASTAEDASDWVAVLVAARSLVGHGAQLPPVSHARAWGKLAASWGRSMAGAHVVRVLAGCSRLSSKRA